MNSNMLVIALARLVVVPKYALAGYHIGQSVLVVMLTTWHGNNHVDNSHLSESVVTELDALSGQHGTSPAHVVTLTTHPAVVNITSPKTGIVPASATVKGRQPAHETNAAFLMYARGSSAHDDRAGTSSSSRDWSPVALNWITLLSPVPGTAENALPRRSAAGGAWGFPYPPVIPVEARYSNPHRPPPRRWAGGFTTLRGLSWRHSLPLVHGCMP